MTILFEILALLELLTAWLFVSLRYKTLPAQMPSLFNGAGDAHGLGDKDQLWLLLILALIFYIFLTALTRLDLPINVPPGTNPATIESVRTQALSTLLGLKVLILAYVTLITIHPTGIILAPDRKILVFVTAILLVFVLGSVARIVLTLRRNAA